MQPESDDQSVAPDDLALTSQHGGPELRRHWSFRSPTPVFDANGEQIGVLSLGSPGDYLVVQRDADGRDLYIPLSAVNRSDSSGVYLSLARADLKHKRWFSPPR